MDYISKYTNYELHLKSGTAFFRKEGALGIFSTDNPELIEELESLDEFNSQKVGGFFRKSGTPVSQSNVVAGTRGGGTAEQVGMKDALRTVFKEYEDLKAEIVKADGDFRKDATEEQKGRFLELKAIIYD